MEVPGHREKCSSDGSVWGDLLTGVACETLGEELEKDVDSSQCCWAGASVRHTRGALLHLMAPAALLGPHPEH